MIARRKEPEDVLEVQPEVQPGAQTAAMEPRARVRFPETDMQGVISGFTRDLFEDFDEYSYRGRGEALAADRLEDMVLVRASFVIGLLEPSNPAVAARLWTELEDAHEVLDGIDFFRTAMVSLGKAISRAGLWGRKGKGVSADDGSGLEPILELSRGTD